MSELTPDGGISAVAAQAGLSAHQRIIPAHSVAAMEQAALEAATAGECLQAARVRCDEQVAQTLRRARREGVTTAHIEATQRLVEFLARVDEASFDAQEQLVTLIVRAVEKIIGGRPPQERIHELALQALSEARTLHGRITLTVHPTVAPDVNQLLQSLENASVDIERLTIDPDPAVSVTACRLSSAAGDIDASLDVQLAALASALLDRRDR